MDLSQLDQDGFQIVPDVLIVAQCDHLIAAIHTAPHNTNLRQPHLQCPEIQNALIKSKLAEFFRPPWRIIRSILFDKTPDANWSVPWHQDLTICVRERVEIPGFGPWSIKDGLNHVHAPADILDQIITIRVHLDDCGPDNGPLRIIPRSQKAGRLTDLQIDQFRSSNPEIQCLIPKAGALLMKPLTLHASSRAKSPHHRRVLHLELSNVELPIDLSWL